MRAGYRLLLPLCLAVALFGLVYPIWVIRPFRHQGAGELQAALFVMRYRGITGMVAALLGIATLLTFWRRESHLARGLAIAATAATLGSATLSHLNVYEQMFHPVGKPAFHAASEAKLDGLEKVLAIRLADTARAYPVRSISYHHVVNDVVGGVPVAATY
jgi:hypothetical protein